jgi:hypothetical protein
MRRVDHDERLRVLRELQDMDIDSREFLEAMQVLREALVELDARAAARAQSRSRLAVVDDPAPEQP